MDQIYVIGHRNPDTDSICSSIALSNLLNLQGYKSKPYRLGEISPETAFVLDFFGYECPTLLTDARNSLQEISLDTPISLHPSMTMKRALEILKKEDRQSLAVLSQGQTIGMLSLSDISKASLFDTSVSIDLLQHTPITNIAQAIEGRIIVNAEHSHLNGKVSVIVLSENHGADYEIQDRIVIAGNDPISQEELIKKGAGMLILVWTDYVSPDIQKIAREHNCSIIISGHGGMNTTRYLFLSSPISLIMKKDITALHAEDWIEDAFLKMTSSRYRSYPVLDIKKELIGYAERYHLMNADNKTVYLVDHNSFYQSVNGIEKANIIGVVDHHRISDFSTIRPVNFRNERLGCTCSIIYKMYRELGYPLEPEIAGLMLSAIISDTLNFKSVTCTQQDRQIACDLAKRIEVDLEEFAQTMFKSVDPLNILSPQEILDYDCKEFIIRNIPIKIAQCTVYNSVSAKEREIEWIQELKERSASGRENIILIFTSLSEQGSLLYWEGPQSSRIANGLKIRQGDFIKDILSRKSQIVPWLEKCL